MTSNVTSITPSSHITFRLTIVFVLFVSPSLSLSLSPSLPFSSYVIEKGVVYLVLCEAGFPKKLAFAYLEDLQTEFNEQHGKKVQTVSRPYSFIEFGERGAKEYIVCIQ